MGRAGASSAPGACHDEVVLISKPVAEAIRAGTVTQAFRRWDAPRVKVGGVQLTPAGLVRFDAVSRVRDPDRLTERDARRAGVKDLATLQKFLAPRERKPSPARRPRRRHGLSHPSQLGRRGPANRPAREPARRGDPARHRRPSRAARRPPDRPVDPRDPRVDPGQPSGRLQGARGPARCRAAPDEGRHPQAQGPRPDHQPRRRLRAVAARRGIPRLAGSPAG